MMPMMLAPGVRLINAENSAMPRDKLLDEQWILVRQTLKSDLVTLVGKASLK
ncbi:hypothetical protein UVI_02057470 [Ustilaginoidea virens]|uniref:Uncharacterized protein n=1 Tax=Ustilaginoidea virens TaxID=1159556 RepID=A0A1B5L1F7_USTVR|nr:hypothetical protein UVI_02057470 [Ustilaginoidea virens]